MTPLQLSIACLLAAILSFIVISALPEPSATITIVPKTEDRLEPIDVWVIARGYEI